MSDILIVDLKKEVQYFKDLLPFYLSLSKQDEKDLIYMATDAMGYYYEGEEEMPNLNMMPQFYEKYLKSNKELELEVLDIFFRFIDKVMIKFESISLKTPINELNGFNYFPYQVKNNVVYLASVSSY